MFSTEYCKKYHQMWPSFILLLNGWLLLIYIFFKLKKFQSSGLGAEKGSSSRDLGYRGHHQWVHPIAKRAALQMKSQTNRRPLYSWRFFYSVAPHQGVWSDQGLPYCWINPWALVGFPQGVLTYSWSTN